MLISIGFSLRMMRLSLEEGDMSFFVGFGLWAILSAAGLYGLLTLAQMHLS